MKITVVCPYDLSIPGGVQAVTTKLVERLRLAGHAAELVGPGDDAAWGGIGKSTTIPANGSRVPIAISPRTRRRVLAAIGEADVIHVHEPLIPLVGPAAVVAGKPTVATFHADPPAWVRRGYRWMGTTLARRFAGATLTAVSPTAAGAIPPRWGEVRVIPNGVSFPPSGAADRDHGMVLFVGRDEPRKGLDVILDAWPEIRSAMTDARLVVVGATRRQTLSGVQFLGRVEQHEKARLLASAGILVAPNLGGESFGIVGVEGQAAGCAVVASDLPAFKDALGDSARFVPPGNPGALAQAVIELLTDPTSARTLGGRGQTHAARYDWEPIIDSYLAAYDHALRVG